MPDNTTIGIADAYAISRLGFRRLVEEELQATVLFEVGDQEGLLRHLAHAQPDIMILDCDQPGRFSTETVRTLRQAYPTLNVLIISDHATGDSVDVILQLGVKGFLTRSCGPEEVVSALNASLRGEKYYCTRIVDYLLEKSYAPTTDSGRAEMTSLGTRELEVLKLVAQGFIAKEIADQLHLSIHTVYTHRKNIMKKLGISSSSEMVLTAIQYGLVSVGD